MTVSINISKEPETKRQIQITMYNSTTGIETEWETGSTYLKGAYAAFPKTCFTSQVW